MKDKFSDIRPGDTVLIRTKVNGYIFETQYFNIPYKVDRVTPKMFCIGDDKFKKSDGCGKGIFAYKTNEKPNEKNKYQEYIKKSHIRSNISFDLYELSRYHTGKLDTSQLEKIQNNLTQIKKILKNDRKKTER